MKTRYIIGFCAVFSIFFLLLTAGYRMSYEHVMEKQAVRDEILGTESIAAEGDAVNNENEIYILSELQGYVVVYLEDEKTIYEITDIQVSTLPQEVQQEIAEGKRIESVSGLYAFLENYSS